MPSKKLVCSAQLGLTLATTLITTVVHLMAEQRIANVESQVGQSVVDKTTDVDVSKSISSATSGGTTEENQIESNTRDLGTTHFAQGETRSGGEVITNSNVRIYMRPAKQVLGNRLLTDKNEPQRADVSRTQTPGIHSDLVDSDMDVGSGSGTPTKISMVEGSSKPTTRASSVKKLQSFKVSKQFLEKTSSTGPSNASTKTMFSSERSS